MIKYYLQPNAVTSDPDDHSARVTPQASLTYDDIVREMLRRGTTVTDSDVQAVLSLFMDVVSDKVTDGNYVNLPIVNIRPGIKGVFANAGDSYDPSRHTVKATVSGGLLLEEKLRDAALQKTSSSRRRPELLSYFDYNSQSTDSILTPGGIGEITGEELKFNPDNDQEGIFLIDTAGNETPVEILSVRTEGRLMFLVPAELPAGDYTLEVRRAYNADGDLRTGVLISNLTVNA